MSFFTDYSTGKNDPLAKPCPWVLGYPRYCRVAQWATGRLAGLHYKPNIPVECVQCKRFSRGKAVELSLIHI